MPSKMKNRHTNFEILPAAKIAFTGFVAAAKQPRIIRPPSKGKIGNKLPNPRARLIKTTVDERAEGMSIAIAAISKFTAGPANAIFASSTGRAVSPEMLAKPPKGVITISFTSRPSFCAAKACPNSCANSESINIARGIAKYGLETTNANKITTTIGAIFMSIDLMRQQRVGVNIVFMIRALSWLMLLCFGAQASAQIYAVDFSDPKFVKKYQKQIFNYNGKDVILVEIRGGFDYKPDGGLSWNKESRLEFFIQDQSDPSKLGYSVDADGMRKTKSKKLVLGMGGDRVSRMISFMANESFYTLSKEYQRRADAIEDMAAQQKETDKASAEWMALNSNMLRETENLQQWMFQTGYTKAANKMVRDISKLKKAGKSAMSDRIESAVASITEINTDPKLNSTAADIGGKDLKFSTQQSRHITIKYHNGIADNRISSLLELGERAIEAFRTQNADPYLDEKFKDFIPDDLFIEFFFSTESQVHQEKFWEDYYGFGWGDATRKAQRLQSSGTGAQQGKIRISYWRITDQSDLEGIIVHQLGHQLARHHYQIMSNTQDWLEEGCGYALSFALLNRNNVTCMAFEPPKSQGGTVAAGAGGKDKDKGKENKTAVVMKGMREIMAGVAAHTNVPFDQLAAKRLHAFENEDMAKSWAFYEYIIASKGKAGQEWLRLLSKAANGGRFQNKIREHTEKKFDFNGQDAIRMLEEQWMAYLREVYDVN